MTRTVSGIISTAITQDVTTPVYLIRMGWTIQSPDITRRIATWDTQISWNSELWEASGAKIDRMDANGGTLKLPNGDTDPWLDLVMTQVARGRLIQIYEYQTSTGSPSGSDAVELFSGIMDAATIDRKGIQITFIASLLNKTFPHTSINTADYPWLLSEGDRIYWGPDVIRVQ